MNHITFGVPMLVLTVPEYLDKLLQNGGLAAVAALCELGGIMVVAVDISVMFVVAVLGSKNG